MILCRSIATSDFDLCAETIRDAQMVELRADLMNLTPEEVGRLTELSRRVIVTCHHTEPSYAIDYYTTAIESGAWAIDVDWERGREYISRIAQVAKSVGCKLILSQHFSFTPSPDTLRSLAEEMFSSGTDIVKIITTATSLEEAIVPLTLYRSGFDSARVVAFAMGQEGRFTRRLSLLMGAPYTYVSPDGKHPTAIGQPSEQELRISLQCTQSLEGLALPPTITPPCSKSEAQRAILCAALSCGESHLGGYTSCDDNRAAIAVAREFGGEIVKSERQLTIAGIGHSNAAQRFRENGPHTLHVGESALTARLTSFLIAAMGIENVDVCTEGTLRHRDMGDTQRAIEAMGGQHWELDGQGSSQHISGAMMSAPLRGGGDKRIVVHNPTSRPYIAQTAKIMRQFGAKVEIEERGNDMVIDVRGKGYTPTTLTLEGDWSSSAYFAAAYAIAQSGHRRADRYCIHTSPCSQQADRAILDVLQRAGANIVFCEEKVEFLPSGRLVAFDYDATDTPDLLPTLAVVALFATGTSHIRGLHRLTNKESNRAESIIEGLLAIGSEATIVSDELAIVGNRPLRAAPLLTHHDHRIAMAFTVASLFMNEKPTLDDSECVAKSYPNFFEHLKNA